MGLAWTPVVGGQDARRRVPRALAGDGRPGVTSGFPSLQV